MPFKRSLYVALIIVLVTSLVGVPGMASSPGTNGSILVVQSDGISTVALDGTITPFQTGSFRGVDVSADGRVVVTVKLAGEQDFEGEVTLIDLQSGASEPLGVQANSAVFSGAERRIVYADDLGVHVLQDGQSQLVAASEGSSVYDGSAVDDRVLADQDKGADFPHLILETIGVVTGDAVTVDPGCPCTYYYTAGDLSPDGTDIIYENVSPGYPALVMAGSGDEIEGGYTLSGTGLEISGGVSFSPDGNLIAYGFYLGEDAGSQGSVVRIRDLASDSVQDLDVPDTEQGIQDIEWLPVVGDDPPPTEPPGDGTTVPLPAEPAGNSDLSVQISQLTFPEDGSFAQAGEVLVASEMVFADALSSGTLQDTRGLLLTDPATLEPAVLAEIQRLGASTVRILGGEAAVSKDVEDALRAEGLEVVRTFGATRLETATAIAELADGPDGFLARAFPAPDATDLTQAFADSLTAGGWAADTGRPLLLTQTEVLSTSTANYVSQSALDGLIIVGGEAAIQPQVSQAADNLVDEVGRVAGTNRFATAVAVATTRGFSPESPAATVIVIEGQAANSWAAGFTVSALAARNDAPILLVNGDAVPPETEQFLSESVATDATVVCIASTTACVGARDRVTGP